MTTERMLEALRQRPFLPFLLHVADGRTVAVSHPEQAALHPQGRTMIVDQPDESWQLVDLLLVTGIEFRESIAS
jgi:hypothetical protein